ncbi:MAG TPA: hypothetical protein VIO83_09540 [Pseudomonas sp.]
MSDIENRARELLAEQYRNGGASAAASEILAGRSSWPNQMALAAIVAAIAPPQGYVLMPVVLPEPMLDVLWSAEADMRDADMQDLWSALIAARPEVP